MTGSPNAADSLAAILRSHWDAAEASLVRVAVRYNEAYARTLEEHPPTSAGTAVENPG